MTSFFRSLNYSQEKLLLQAQVMVNYCSVLTCLFRIKILLVPFKYKRHSFLCSILGYF